MSFLGRLFLYGCLQLGSSKLFRHDCDIPLVDGTTLTLADFEEKRGQQHPMLIMNLTETWPARSRWQSPQFAQNYGEAPLPRFDVHKGRLKLREYIASEDHSRIFGPAELKRFVLPWLRDDFEVPEQLVGVFEDPMLFIGGAASRHDGKDNFFEQYPDMWMSLISGRHRWFLQRPDQLKRYRRTALLWTQDMLEQDKSSLRCTQHAGDTIYIPEKWWSTNYVLAADSSNLSVAVGGMGDSMPVLAASVYGSMKAVKEAAGPWKKVRQQYVNEANKNHVLPIHMAQNVEVLKFLHKYGADVNAQTNNEDTPLIEATRACLLPNMEWLLNNGANISARNKQGMSAFHVASEACPETGFVDFLLKQSADVNDRNSAGVTPLYSAISWGNIDVAKWLLKNGADLKAPQPQSTPLIHPAAASGSETMLSWIISQGAKIDDKDADGIQAIHVAAELGRLPSLEYLLKRRANLQANDNPRYIQPVHFAVLGGHVDILSWMKDNGADFKANMSGGLTPLEQAQAMADERYIPGSVVDYLKQAQITVTRKDEL